MKCLQIQILLSRISLIFILLIETNNIYSQQTGKYIDKRDGKTYSTVKLGGQVWFAENLNFYADEGSWCYNDSPDFCSTYGKLYTFDAARNACPGGWNLPTDKDWAELEEFLLMPENELSNTGYRGSFQGKKLKQGGDSKFESLLAGQKNPDEFLLIDRSAVYWTETSLNPYKAWCRGLNYENDGIMRDNFEKDKAFSVRCIKEETVGDQIFNKNLRYGSITDSRDNKEYKTITIGGMTWTAQNIAYLENICPDKEDCGTWVNQYKGYLIQEAVNSDNYKKYGVLYNFEKAKTACPAGWHLPTQIEWEKLIKETGGKAIAGGKLKSIDSSWKMPNTGASNESGFSALPGGYRYYSDKTFAKTGEYADFWSSTTNDKGQIIYYYINYDSTKTGGVPENAKNGHSVRCVKD